MGNEYLNHQITEHMQIRIYVTTIIFYCLFKLNTRIYY